MSNNSSCIFVLTQLIGFQQSDNGEKIILPDEVEIDALIAFKTFLQDSIDNINDKNSNYDMKVVENNDALGNGAFWECEHCTYHNQIDANLCQDCLHNCHMCGLPRNVCARYKMIVYEKREKKEPLLKQFCELLVVFATLLFDIPEP